MVLKSLKVGVLAAMLMMGSVAQAQDFGRLAEHEMRHFATHFKGRMAGTPMEKHAMDYVAHELRQMGYTVEIYSFDTDYGFTHGDGFKSKRPVKSYNVVATKKGASDKVVVVGSHVDSRLPRHEKDFAKRLGGKDLEGIDDNASGIGMLLELANQIKDTPTENTVKFVAFGAEEIGLKGSHEYIKRLSAAEKQNTIMMINMDSLITGDKMYFHAGKETTAKDASAFKYRDMALAKAKELNIPAETNPGLNKDYPAGTGCCSDLEPFDEAGIPVLAVEATDWTLGDKDGYEQTSNPAIKGGLSWHLADVDNVKNMDKVFPGRIKQRATDFSRILTPVLLQIAGAKK